jgi:hypothetical protein
MEARELRIGNHIEYKEQLLQVKSISESLGVILSDYIDSEWGKIQELASYKSIKPIPLTEEWLLKFGFEKSHLNYWIIANKGFFFGVSLKMGVMYLFDEGMITPCNIKHVHQLQNLYFALTNKELQIN